ncbi:MAG: restriction endonuclease subunit S [Candidatus Methanoperedens sp.]|nr:restriction endonuclease subunit S [Candidatus Methanoperedens sp.]
MKTGEQYSFIEMKDLSDGQKYCFPSVERKLTGGSRFKEGDTLFARITPCLENGKICKVKGLKDGLGFGSTEFFVFRGKEGISDNDFVFYLSRWNEVRAFAEINFDGTSGRQRVPKDAFNNLFLNLPDLPEQRAIASVLSSLDDKIDLLHRQNRTLEGMAEALFRQWFVEEAEEGWRIDTLRNVFDIGIGRTPPRKEQHWFSTNPDDIKWVSIKDMGISGIYIDTTAEYLTKEAVEKFNVPIIPENTVIRLSRIQLQ